MIVLQHQWPPKNPEYLPLGFCKRRMGEYMNPSMFRHMDHSHVRTGPATRNGIRLAGLVTTRTAHDTGPIS
jgi:hypothetical protein